jgi:hypothetical protein
MMEEILSSETSVLIRVNSVTSRKTVFFVVTAVKTASTRLGPITEKKCVSCDVRTGFYIPEDGILHSFRRENLRSYIAFTL